MKRVALVVAVVMLFSILAASIAVAATLPGGLEARANVSGSPAPDAAVQQRPKITDDSMWNQFGFCDDKGDESPAAY